MGALVGALVLFLAVGDAVFLPVGDEVFLPVGDEVLSAPTVVMAASSCRKSTAARRARIVCKSVT